MILRGYICIITAASLWGLIGPVSKLAFQEGILPMEVAFWRAVLAWACFGIHAMIARQLRIDKKDIPLLVVFGITGVTLFYGSYQIAIKNGGAALAAVLLYTAPAWVMVLSRIIFKETVTLIKMVALLLTIAGVVGVSIGGGGLNTIVGGSLTGGAILSGLAAGFFYSLYYIFGKHFSLRYSSQVIFMYILPIGAIGLLPWIEFVHKSVTAWIALGFLAFFSTYLAYMFYYVGVKYLEASRAAITATIEPVIAAIVAFFWWGEYFTFNGYLGSIAIITGVILMIGDGIIRSKRKSHELKWE